MILKQAIKTISWYCMKHKCSDCRLGSEYGVCILAHEVPCDWEKRMQGEEDGEAE